VPRRPLVGLAAAFAAAVAFATVAVTPRLRDSTTYLPPRLTDSAFWQLIDELSEPGGTFLSSNYVSNERDYQRVIPELEKHKKPGGVYIGVGPDQNFTYISALQPAIAFIVDIRRENMLLHLMHKALIELSPDRAAFLARLFSRPPADVERASPPRALLDAYAAAVPDETRLEQNVRAVADCLVRRHGFALTPGDLETIARAQRAFFDAGPELRYAYPHRVYPTYAELMVETDNRGEPRSYLSSEEAFLEVKRLEEKNLIVPVVGDFAGGKALRAVGAYLRRRRATVNVFYTSNVEFYLRETGGLPRFFDNVAALPVDRDSIFIRASFTDEPAMRVDAIGEPRTLDR
jgi:hypothetical protein